MLKYQAFVFENYTFDQELKTLICRYSFDSEQFFEEKIIFDFDFVDDFDEEALERAFYSLWVMAGISYFKAALPSKIIIKKGDLDSGQRAFFQKIYKHGLGEFFFMNDIDPAGKVNFETKKQVDCRASLRFARNDGVQKEDGCALVPLGGGKDSLTTIEILKSQGIDFETITVDSDERFEAVSKIIGKNHLNISRKMSPELIRLNNEGALNGHVPISSIWAFMFVCTAILRGSHYIILSNENSANEATGQHAGMDINHQYSKTLEFEKDFQDYIGKNISPEVNYFSFLRPLTELNIAQIFCSRVSREYKGFFSSCNRNFKIKDKTISPFPGEIKRGCAQSDNAKFQWCNECSKCTFVFTIFSPFLSREELIEIFGENLYAKVSLVPIFDELLGLTDHKPFECVGEVIEVRKAMMMAVGKFPEITEFVAKFSEDDQAVENFDYQKLHPHSMGADFESVLNDYLMEK